MGMERFVAPTASGPVSAVVAGAQLPLPLNFNLPENFRVKGSVVVVCQKGKFRKSFFSKFFNIWD